MERNKYPRFAFRILTWFCPGYLSEGIEGDLLEQFEEDRYQVGEKVARRRFIWNTLKFFRTGIILRNKFSVQIINTIMLRSYFKITYRNILKNKGYSFINIFGLSLGIACCLIMFNYVRFEFSYDNFHPHLERTFRVDQKLPWSLDEQPFGSTAPPLANTLVTNYPEIEEAMRINTPGDFMIRFSEGDRNLAFVENRVFAADSNFFAFFGFKLKEGDPATALKGIHRVVISDAIAKKFFGDLPALGKTLQMGDNRVALEITGVTEPQPENTHFHFDYLLSMATNPNVKKRDWSWVWTQVVTYVRLKPGADAQALEEKLVTLGEKVIRPAFESRGMDYQNGIKGKITWNFYLRPMRDIHLRSGSNRFGPVGDIRYVWTFGVIGVFVLIIASINFINLSTARGTKRAKEVGVKKTLGAMRGGLMSQFQAESIFLTTFSTLLALILVEGLRLIISGGIGIQMPFTLWNDTTVLLMLPFIPLVIGFLAGLYPAFYLTAFRPVEVLKGKIASGMGNSVLRNALVVIQFTISITLIAGTIIVFQQLNFIRSTNLGFDKENVLLIKYAEKLGTNLEAFRNEVENFPGVVHAGIAMEVPGGNTWSDDLNRENSDVGLSMAIVKTDEHFLKTLDFKMAAGRAFEKERPPDRNAIILNETAVRLSGWTPDEAIGQYLIYPGNGNSRHEIIGVVKDFHNESLRQAITPVLFCKVGSDIWGDWFTLTIKYKTSDLNGLITKIEDRWNAMLDDTPMSYSFLDQHLARQYQMDQRQGGLFGIFSALSILIAIIGLVGLVSYSTEVRKKEIGIRKVFGASTSRIVLMMNSQYIRLILFALVIAVPFTWLAITQWLDSFAYRIDISPLTFIAAGIAQLVLAMLSVGYLSLRAASLNPSQVLKEE